MHSRSQISSFSDDKTVKIWDIPTEKCLQTYSVHTDYVRAGAITPAVPDVILSGSYDGTVKMYDTRTENVLMSVEHGSPVESLLFLPSGGIFLTAGGTEIKIWDSIAGGKLLGCISQHHKTITCLRLASNNKRLLSGSLDRHIKVYDIATFQVVHTLDYPNAVLSLGVSKNDDTLVAGLVDGLVSISRREDEQKTEQAEKRVSFRNKVNFQPVTVDEVISENKKEIEAKHDRCLRKFEYSKALDCVLLPYTVNKHPEVTVSLMQELMRRKALARAFSGRTSKSVLQIIKFFIKNITDNRFARILIPACNIFLDVYESSMNAMPSNLICELVVLSKLLKQENKVINDLESLQGMMNMLLAAASAPEEDMEVRSRNEPHNLVPSEDAKKNLIVNLT